MLSSTFTTPLKRISFTMSTYILFLSIMLLLSLSGQGGGAVEVAAAAPSVDCTTLVLGLADCLSFVSAGSEVDKPEGTCCPGLKTVLKSHAECLCEAFKNSAQFGVTLNVSKALTLPAQCHVSAPSIANCGLNIISGGAPASAPIGAMPPSPIGSPISHAGSIEAPAPASSTSVTLAFPMGFLVISSLALFIFF